MKFVIVMDLIASTGTDLFQDLKGGVSALYDADQQPKGKMISTQSSTLFIGLVKGYFTAFSRRWIPGTKWQMKESYFSNYAQNLFHFKRVLSVGFWTEFLQTHFPPKSGFQNKSSRTGHNIRVHRFIPYQTEPIEYPLAIYVCIVVLVLFLVILLLNKRNEQMEKKHPK